MTIRKRVFALATAAVLMLTLLPVGAITLQASADGATQITSTEDLGWLGKPYNLLGDEPLNGTTLLQSSSIFKSMENIDASVSYESETEYSYSYTQDLSSSLQSQSNSLKAEIGVDAKIKLVSLSAKASMGLTSSSSSAQSSKNEYATFSVTHKELARYMDLKQDSQKQILWEQDADDNYITLDDDFIAAIDAFQVKKDAEEDFFKAFGTHIVTGYAAGGVATATYSSEEFSSSLTESMGESWSASVSGDISGFFKVSGEFAQEQSNSTQSDYQGKSISVFSQSFGGASFSITGAGYDSAAIDSYVESVTEENAAVLIDETDALSLMPVWELLEASGEPEYIEKAEALESYFNSKIVEQNKEFYQDYLGETYISEAELYAATEYINEDNLQIITTEEQLNNIRNDMDGAYVLACNIDLSGYSNWTPIGTDMQPFMGKLYGNGNTVSGLNIDIATNGYAGLFGYVGQEGYIGDLRVQGAIAEQSDAYVGGVAAYNRGTIANCYDEVKYYSFNQNDTVYQLEDDMQIVVGTQAVRLVGAVGTTFSGVNLVVEDAATPAYIFLENTDFVGGSTQAAIYSDNDRPIYLVSQGTSNQIKGAAEQIAVDAANADLTILGTADLTIRGGDGSDGANGSSGMSGKNGNDGAIGVTTQNIVISAHDTVYIAGGNGGNGGDGGDGAKGTPSYNGHSDRNAMGGGANGGDGKDGGNGGNAGKGGYAYNVNSVIVYNGTVTVAAGASGDGGDGGNGGEGGKGQEAGGWNSTAGNGGNGGDGGQGGDSYIIAASSGSENVIVYNGNFSAVNGEPGTVGKYGSAGKGGAKGMHCDGANCGQVGTWGDDGQDGSSGRVGSSGNIINEGNKATESPSCDATLDGFIEHNSIPGIIAGYNEGTISYPNSESWNGNRLSIDSVAKTFYYTGESFDPDSVVVSLNGQEIKDYSVTFYTYQTGYRAIALARNGCETRYIPVYVQELLPTAVEIVPGTGQTNFVVGQEFSVSGLRLMVTYNNGSVKEIDVGHHAVSISEPAMTVGQHTVTVTYDEGGNAEVQTCCYDIYVADQQAVGIEVTPPIYRTYDQYDSLDLQGMTVRLVLNDGSKDMTISLDDPNLSITYDFTIAGERTVAVQYRSLPAVTFTCTVQPVNVTAIEIIRLPDKTDYLPGDSLDATGLQLQLSMSNGKMRTIDSSADGLSYDYDFSSAGEKIVTVSYEGHSDTFVCNVAIPADMPKITVSSAVGAAGGLVKVSISLENNPGITVLRMQVEYDTSRLALVTAEDEGVLGSHIFGDDVTRVPYILYYNNNIATENFTVNGTVATLMFRVLDDAELGDAYVRVAALGRYDAMNADGDEVSFATVDGNIEVSPIIYGDVDGDGSVTARDAMFLSRYIAGYDVDILAEAADLDRDGAVTARDAMILARHIAGWNDYAILPMA